MTSMFIKEEDQLKFDAWSKEDVYEAYLAERLTRVRLNKELNVERSKLALIKNQVKLLLKDI